MKIAVTYENGQIFQHFGHSENFKIYETEGKNIVSAKVIGTDGAGVGSYLKSKNEKIKIIAVEPAGSPILSKGISGTHKIQGIGQFSQFLSYQQLISV